MKIVDIKCTNCGASIEPEEELEYCFCKYCGQKVMLEEEGTNIKMEETVNINDAAKIKEADVKENIAKMSFFADAESKNRNHLLAILAAIWFLMIVVAIVIVILMK